MFTMMPCTKAVPHEARAQYTVGSDDDNATALRDSTQHLCSLMGDDAFEDFEEVFSAAHIQDVSAYARWTPHKGRLLLAETIISQLHMDAASSKHNDATATSLLRAFARSAVSHCDQLSRSLAGSEAHFSPVRDAVVVPGAPGSREHSKTVAAPSVGVIQVTRDTPAPSFMSSLVQPARPTIQPQAAAHRPLSDEIPFVESGEAQQSQHRHTRRPVEESSDGAGGTRRRRRHRTRSRRSEQTPNLDRLRPAVRFSSADGRGVSSSEVSSSTGHDSAQEGTLSDEQAAAPQGLSRVQRVHTPAKHKQHLQEKRAPIAFSVDMTGGGGRKNPPRQPEVAPPAQQDTARHAPSDDEMLTSTQAAPTKVHSAVQDAQHNSLALPAAAAAPAAPPVAWEISLSPQEAAAARRNKAAGRPKRSFFSPPQRKPSKLATAFLPDSQESAPPSQGAAATAPPLAAVQPPTQLQYDHASAGEAAASLPAAAAAGTSPPAHSSADSPSGAAGINCSPNTGSSTSPASRIPALRKSPSSTGRQAGQAHAPDQSAQPSQAAAGCKASAVVDNAAALRAAVTPEKQSRRQPPPSPFEAAASDFASHADERGDAPTVGPETGPVGPEALTSQFRQQHASDPALHAADLLAGDSGSDSAGWSFADEAAEGPSHQFVAPPKHTSGEERAALPASPARSVAADDVLLPWHSEQQCLSWEQVGVVQTALPVRCAGFDGTGRYCAIGTNSKALLVARLPNDLFDAENPTVEAADGEHWGAAADRVHRVAVPRDSAQTPLSIVREYAPFHAGSVYSLAWGNNSGNDCSALVQGGASSSLLATCSNDAAIHVLKWQGEGSGGVQGDTSGPEPVALIRGHSGTLRSVAFLNAGTLAAAGGRDFKVRLWDVAAMRTGSVHETEAATESELQALQGHTGTVFGVCRFSSAGAKQPLLASCSEDGSVRLWDCRAGDSARVSLHVCSASGSPVAVHGVAVDHMSGVGSGDAMPLAAACADGHVRLLDVRGTRAGGVVDSAAFHTGSDCRTVAFAPGGGLLASGGFDGTVALSSCSLGVLSAKYRMACAHTDKVLSVAWHPWAPILVTTGADNSAKIWAGYA